MIKWMQVKYHLNTMWYIPVSQTKATQQTIPPWNNGIHKQRSSASMTRGQQERIYICAAAWPSDVTAQNRDSLWHWHCTPMMALGGTQSILFFSNFWRAAHELAVGKIQTLASISQVWGWRICQSATHSHENWTTLETLPHFKGSFCGSVSSCQWQDVPWETGLHRKYPTQMEGTDRKSIQSMSYQEVIFW